MLLFSAQYPTPFCDQRGPGDRSGTAGGRVHPRVPTILVRLALSHAALQGQAHVSMGQWMELCLENEVCLKSQNEEKTVKNGLMTDSQMAVCLTL